MLATEVIKVAVKPDEAPTVQIKLDQIEVVPHEEVRNRINLESIAQEFVGVKARIAEYAEQLRQSDTVVIMIGCSDARVGTPITMIDGVSYIYLPVIGGGVPEKELLEALLNQLRQLNINVYHKVQILLTQHGDTQEVTHILAGRHKEANEHITCGLRGVIHKHKNKLEELRTFILRYDRSKIPDDLLNIISLINKLPELLQIPKRLILNAVLNNSSSNMQANLVGVKDEILKFNLGLASTNDQLITGYYDHQERIVHLTARDGISPGSINFNMEKWEKHYQDPAIICVSFGIVASVTHNGVLMPKIIGLEPGNSFDTSATVKSQLMGALSAAWYAANNAAKGGHDENFVTTKAAIIICDNDQYIELAKEVLNSVDFKEELESAYAAIGPIYLVNLEKEGSEDGVEEIILNKTTKTETDQQN